ncbi:MAG: murein DD-endopeptidase MepM/ murein hydrolase activator NlpD [Cognaticolwellia sp.]|jgi:murein DD-endopeptidase MepM/ murein hydrolase activator NlpD
MRRSALLSLLAFIVTAGVLSQQPSPSQATTPLEPHPPWADLAVADGFDFPVGQPDANGYYDAQPFGRNDHLGSDWNGRGGGDSDLGDPVFATAAGYVRYAREAGPGWCNVMIVVHRVGEQGPWVESLYGHLDSFSVPAGSEVLRGQALGAIGSCEGRYAAHLHFEVRSVVGGEVGPGYAKDKLGWVDPTAFIEGHRP